ncbi:MAG: anthranilate phosphoribosyltransferase [Candidatus Taylorbacteria bacterium CG11_big_fil_rev_8_21_14_0_20_46_11]|uniref:Anthranilate phosphoribosyltransferase n=1 Tax=Candidatus Taylorbacteria bacterium CG11_big_fil_rev_8_21_14_0_20_46_11 TaxID=1975025 RepID=A0A2H0KF43_9BACT|nr:MAG: anthranilate phosphoribosyltransferase [Candidatus Taylorbacteria bacterium CG11_big_fil_rev_8_21_14_0_20_46_11]
MTIAEATTKIAGGATLTESEALSVQSSILAGEAQTPTLVAFFEAFKDRKVSAFELRGFFRASLSAMTPLETGMDTLDTCGTGGDGSGSFNISTVSALLCATAGVPVAKHGNRAASSKCGSADVLEALGVKIELSPEQAKTMLEQTGFVFLFARSYHPAFKHAGEARKLFGKKTYFNFLGPLLNPAKASYRVHGLSDFSLAETLGDILIESGVRKAWLVHAEDGLDEVSPMSLTHGISFSTGGYSEPFNIDPKEHGLAIEDGGGLTGGDVKKNAEILISILQGKGTEAQNAVTILNTAAGLTVSGRSTTFADGVRFAKALITSGAGYEKLQDIVKASNEV